jgi:Uma2 family endonuclease
VRTPRWRVRHRRSGRRRVLRSRRRSARHRLFRPERAHLVDLRSAIRHAPDLCVEILSPSTEATDRGRKLQMFARYGVPEYWIVDPVAEVIEVHRLEASGYVLTQRASGDDEVQSAVVGGTPIRARQIFP